jgi:hypothetical protein
MTNHATQVFFGLDEGQRGLAINAMAGGCPAAGANGGDAPSAAA